MQYGRGGKLQRVHGHSFMIVIDCIGYGAMSMNEEDNIPKSRFKLSFSSNPRMTWPIGFVIWESGGKLDVSLTQSSTPRPSG